MPNPPETRPSGTPASPSGEAGISLGRYLTRVIWIGAAPLLLLAAFLSFNYVVEVRRDLESDAAAILQQAALNLDRSLSARTRALELVARARSVLNPEERARAYEMAAGFFEIYGTHVIVADTQLQMLINTRLPLGAPLPKLPVPAGRSAVALVLSTGKPAFGDSFVGPIAGTTLAALCVPVLRDGQVMALVLTTVDADYFLSRMPTLAMPAEWTLSVRDSTGAVMARLGPAAAGAASAHPFQSSLGASGWSVHLEIPNAAYRRPVLVASAVMLLVLGLAVAAALLAGSVASRRLRDALLRLASAPGPTASKASGIAEVDALDRQLGEARSALGASERSYRVLFEDHPHPMFVLDAKSYRFIAVNGAALTHYGYSREEFLAMTVADIRPEEDRPRLAAFLEGLRPREAPAMSALGVWTHRLKDGRLIEVEVSSSEIEF